MPISCPNFSGSVHPTAMLSAWGLQGGLNRAGTCGHCRSDGLQADTAMGSTEILSASVLVELLR